MKPTWKNTLSSENIQTGFFKFGNMAKDLGYLFFMWNDRVYLTEDKEETEFTIEDLEPKVETDAEVKMTPSLYHEFADRVHVIQTLIEEALLHHPVGEKRFHGRISEMQRHFSIMYADSFSQHDQLIEYENRNSDLNTKIEECISTLESLKKNDKEV